LIGWVLVRFVAVGFFTVDQSERAVKTSFDRAERVGTATTLDIPIAQALNAEERQRYSYPQLRVIHPGGPYFKWPWESVYKITVATQTMNMAYDPILPTANEAGTVLEAVTKDQLNTGLKGQIRYRISDQNLYAYLFGVNYPIAHVMGYFVSVLRERIANFEAPPVRTSNLPTHDPTTGAALKPEIATAAIGISINDLRKNLSDINDHMSRECASSEARYGIDPPPDVESALAAINTAYNQVSSDISLAQASADQKIVQSKRAVEIETLKAQAEVEPLMAMAKQLADLKKSGPDVLSAYLRNVRLKLFSQAKRVIQETRDSSSRHAGASHE
jgi:hypothetical protein